MPKTLIQFRVEENTKSQAAKICEILGIDLPTYYRMCTSRLIQEGGIPFGLKIENTAPNAGIEAMRKLQKTAEANGVANMTLDEINAEIVEARKGS